MPSSCPLHDVGAPRLYAANDTGAVLVDYIPGQTLAVLALHGALSDREWQMVGTAYRRIHAVQFPAPLRGPFGPERLELTPEDPVDLLHSKIDTARACSPLLSGQCCCPRCPS